MQEDYNVGNMTFGQLLFSPLWHPNTTLDAYYYGLLNFEYCVLQGDFLFTAKGLS